MHTIQGYVYILQSTRSGRYYVGSAPDPARRFKQHNIGLVVATRNKGPRKIAGTVAFPDRTLASKAETFLKRQKSRKIVEAVIAGTFVWPKEFVGRGRSDDLPETSGRSAN